MEATGKLTGAMRTFDGKNLILTFECESLNPEQIEELQKQDKLKIKAVKYKERRSLDANAYAWVLMTKIANHPSVSSSKEEVYEHMLQKYGSFYEDEEGYITITVKKSVDMSKVDGHWKFIKDNGKFASYLMIKGSSEYDTAEMSHFIDRIAEEAKDLGIETLPPSELEEMKERWGV